MADMKPGERLLGPQPPNAALKADLLGGSCG
jgi:hypothetical protein